MSIVAAQRRLIALIAAKPGERLPSERELAERLAIGRQQLRSLLKDCAERGLIDRRHGSGTYCVDPRGGRIARVGVVLDANLKLGEDPFFMAVIESVQAACESQGYAVELARAPGRAPTGDGLIAIGRAAADAWAHASVPRVAWLVDGAAPGVRASTIELDDAAGGAAAVDRLVASGCTRVVFAGHAELPSPRARRVGAMTRCRVAGVPFSAVDCGLNLPAGHAVADTLPRGHLGVIAANDWLAVGIRSRLLALGRDAVPVIGFDGLPMSAAIGISSLAVPIQTIAADIVAELHRLSSSPAAPGRRLVYPLEWRSEAVASAP